MKFQKVKYFLGIFLMMIFFLIPIHYYFELTILESPIYFIGKKDVNTSQGKIFNNMYANYTFEFLGSVNNSQFTYTQVSGNFYNVTWVNAFGTSSWIENKLTRITSNGTGSFCIRNGRNSFLWLFTNITLGNLALIAIDGVDNHIFNVSDELTTNYVDIGNINVWVLQDLIQPPGIAWYEKKTGILINGTFFWYDNNFSLTLTSTNIFEYYQYKELMLGIPGYCLTIFIPLLFIMFIVILRKIYKNLSKN